MEEKEMEMVEGEKEVGNEELSGRELESKFLTEKSVRMMRVIAEHGYLTINEIGLVYKHQTHGYRVLKGLKELGLIDEFDTCLRPKTGYVLRAKGYRILKERGQLRLRRRFSLEDFKTFIFGHRMACAKVGLILEEHPLVKDFMPESLLWERRRDPKAKLCDGEFLFKAPGYDKPRRVGLEVELSLKNSTKLRESFRSLTERGDLDQVWWICGNRTIARAMAHWIGRICRPDQQHFIGSLDEVLKAKDEFSMHDFEGQVYTVAKGSSTLPEQPKAEPPPRPDPPAAAPPPAQSALPLAIPQALEQPEPEYQEPARLSAAEAEGWRRYQRDTRLGLVLLLAALAFVAFQFKEILPAVKPDFPLMFAGFKSSLMSVFDSPPAPQKPLRWIGRKPNAIFWALGNIHFSLPLLESRGNQFRMKIELERYSEYDGGCFVKSVAVADKNGAILGKWPVGESIWGRNDWLSGPMTFHAPSGVRHFEIVLEMQPDWDCKTWRVPVSFN